MQERKVYDREFKENAVKLSMQRDDISVLARELGIDKDLHCKWRTQYKKNGKESFPGKWHTCVSGESKSVELLKKENLRLPKENDILKKAMSIISLEIDL